MVNNRWVDLVVVMLANPPDPNEPLPRVNQSSTICGVIFSFLIITILCVGFRLYVRCFVVREPGWDDVFVALAAITSSIGISLVGASTRHGLGHHFLYLTIPEMTTYLKMTYFANNTYITSAVLIKISLLLQYLRIFKAGIMRLICRCLLGVTILWGCAFLFIGWFGCLPPAGFWDTTLETKCYGFGFGDDGVVGFVAAFKAHASTNMCLDIAIFAIPLVLFKRPDLKIKTVLAMIGMFVCGAVVVVIAAWRLYSIVENGAGMRPYPDPTWFTPIYAILSSLEIELAIACASMPIFWPIIEQSFAAIFVSYDVEIVEQRVDGHGMSYELEHKKSHESRKSSSASTEELTQGLTQGKTQFSVGLDPLDTEAQNDLGPQTHIGSQPQRSKWEI